LRIVAETYPAYKPKKYRLVFDDREIRTRALFITLANSDQFGFNTSIAPGAKIDDGLLDVVIAAKPNIIELPYLASLLYWRKIEQSKYINTIKTKSLTIQTRRKRWVNIDGEPVKLGKKIDVVIQPQSLNVIVP
jgi:diacylglycerol kinase family enzyme